MKDIGLGIHRVAKKSHKCSFCEIAIEVGDKYIYYRRHLDDGNWETHKSHFNCAGKLKEFLQKRDSLQIIDNKRTSLDWRYIYINYKLSWSKFYLEFLSNFGDFKGNQQLVYTFLEKLFDVRKLYSFFDSRNLRLFITTSRKKDDVEHFSFVIKDAFGNLLYKNYDIYLDRFQAEVIAFEKMFSFMESALYSDGVILSPEFYSILKQDFRNYNKTKIKDKIVL
jgi:hypothetical protein